MPGRRGRRRMGVTGWRASGPLPVAGWVLLGAGLLGGPMPGPWAGPLAGLGAPVARAAGVGAGLRVREAIGYDSNLREQVAPEAREGEIFLRRQADFELVSRDLLPAGRVEAAARGLLEQYEAEREEDRRQGELSLSWSASEPAARRRISVDGGVRGRDYPDSSRRAHWQAWARAAGGVPVGPHGSLLGRLQVWTLEFRRTQRRDRNGLGFELAYEHPLHRRWTAVGGIELGSAEHGFPSLRIAPEASGQPGTPVWGRDREDHARFAHLGLRKTGKILVQARYGFRSQRSNSIDGRYRRHEVSWVLAGPLVLGASGQFVGQIGWTRYTDPALDDYVITRVGEIEAGDEDNTVAVRISRPLGGGLSADLRVGWYRNESATVAEYYEKTVTTLGIGWGWGESSGF